MPNYIHTDLPLCVGCNKCVRVCPLDTGNVTYLDVRGKLKVRIDQTKCLACGGCLAVCPRGARHYVDDSERLLAGLAAGERISLLVAPTVTANVPEHRRFYKALKDLGVNRIFSLSAGQEIHVWATLRHLEQSGRPTMIASYCPVLTSYCQSTLPELLPRLSPVASPESIMGWLLKTRLGLEDDLAVLSACLACGHQPDPLGPNIKYSLSFGRFQEILAKGRPFQLPEDGVGHDPVDPLLGLSPEAEFSGSFEDSMAFFMGEGFRVDRYHGPKALDVLHEYGAADPAILPRVLEALICEHGCAMGPGRSGDLNSLAVNHHKHADRLGARCGFDRSVFVERQAALDRLLNLGDLLVDRRPAEAGIDYVPEERLQEAFDALDKHTTAQKTIDCFACGSSSCLEMARKVALGVNLPSNCVFLAKQIIANSGRKVSDYLQLVRLIGEYMLASGFDDISSTTEHSLLALCSSLDISRASIWRNYYDANEMPNCDLAISFPARIHFRCNVINNDTLPGWLDRLADGEVINKSWQELTIRERSFFSGRDTSVMAMIPIMAMGEFWGTVLVARRHSHPFTKEEISVIESSSFLIISSLISATNDAASHPFNLPESLG